jgi:hypothetical protein
VVWKLATLFQGCKFGCRYRHDQRCSRPRPQYSLPNCSTTTHRGDIPLMLGDTELSKGYSGVLFILIKKLLSQWYRGSWFGQFLV